MEKLKLQVAFVSLFTYDAKRVLFSPATLIKKIKFYFPLSRTPFPKSNRKEKPP
jgi:hypothetical protein